MDIVTAFSTLIWVGDSSRGANEHWNWDANIQGTMGEVLLLASNLLHPTSHAINYNDVKRTVDYSERMKNVVIARSSQALFENSQSLHYA